MSFEINSHPTSVNPRVSSSRSGYIDWFLEKNGGRFFQIFLDAWLFFLNLKAVKTKTVVFDEEGVVYFSPPISSMILLYSS
ncbi:hypothetical protein A0128_07050 [Leptospira tipperaryensis]|uniref:Uncharacterized protein n=1 Tax=Leptospira tipperaryensis TaxID=2564040 RepID=A0A1D7UVK4_9LEPT|nr:hypothetical protein A0128_07050 [Leptospira tipperaryensis]